MQSPQTRAQKLQLADDKCVCVLQGVPVVQAPGEGEAMCAALNQQGLVDGCATLDGDVLLFGARTVYHTFKLQVGRQVQMYLIPHTGQQLEHTCGDNY